MNKSKKIICGVLVLVCIFSSAFSFDWGGSSNTSFSVYDAAAFPTEEATLSIDDLNPVTPEQEYFLEYGRKLPRFLRF